MSTHENTAPKADLYHRVTDAIVNAVESGIGQHRMPWAVRQDRGFRRISVGSAEVAA
jgi:antirestriction protein ArdC